MTGRILTWLGCLLAVGCAARAEPVSYPPAFGSPADHQQPSEIQEPKASDFQEASPSQSLSGTLGQSGQYAQPPEATSFSSEITLLLEDVSVAEQLALSGQGGCMEACRALRSMERSVARLCSLADEQGQPRACEEARRRFHDAKVVVRSACAHCSGGPELGDH
jgi:hypothetical protein